MRKAAKSYIAARRLDSEGPMPNKDRDWIRSAGQASSIGLVLVISIAIGYFFGSWLDKVFHRTDQLFMIIFTLLGVAAGFIEVIRIAISLSKDE